ncbi:MAG TPA: PHP domain-containing protein [Acidimicrobiia bacterium]|nr:PHP domain-containing protein [Acidimicrobiia bacterium]
MERSPKQRFARLLWDLAGFERAMATRRSFRAKAYREAVWALDDLSPGLVEGSDELMAVPRIGRGIAGLIAEFKETGRLRRLEDLTRTLPTEAAVLSRLPRMTPSRLQALKLGKIETADDLITAIDSGRLLEIRGLGEATGRAWRDRLEAGKEHAGIPIYRARAFAVRLAQHLERHVPGSRATPVGEVRRLEEWVSEVALLLWGNQAAIDFLAASALVQGLQDMNGEWRLDTLEGQAVVRQTAPARLGTALVLSTGPHTHLAALERAGAARGLSGWWPAATEEEFYERLSSPPLPPPARSERFPLDVPVIYDRDLAGDLHLHSNWSPDGRQSLAELAATARSLGRHYVAVTDHTHGLRFGGLSGEGLRRQKEELELARAANLELTIFHGAELNVGRDGAIDVDDDDLAMLDFRLAGIHSHFGLSATEQTERLLRVVQNPLIHAISHLMGRRIGVRPPIEVDLDPIFEAAAEAGTALEVNGHLDRLDLPGAYAARAVQRGVKLLVNSDAHRPTEHENTAHAVAVLQRAEVGPEMVLNTLPQARFCLWLERKRVDAVLDGQLVRQ